MKIWLGASIATFAWSALGSAAAAAPAGADGRVAEAAFLPECPVSADLEPGADKRSLIGSLLLSVAKSALTKAAEAAAEWAAKENEKLNAVVTYSGHRNLYRTVVNGKASGPAGCLVIARFPAAPISDEASGIEQRLAPYQPVYHQAGFSVFGDPADGAGRGAPDFYAEFAMTSALPIQNAKGDAGFAGFTLKPTFVYFGATAAKRPATSARKSLRAEIELTRIKLDTGALADKPYYSAGFDLSKDVGLTDDRMPARSQLTPAQLRTVSAGPPAVYPAPADLKAAVAFASDGAALAAPLVDPMPTRIQVQIIEAEEPSFIMRALAKASAANKDKLKEAAEGAAGRIATAIESATN